jgi:hypothetical protein
MTDEQFAKEAMAVDPIKYGPAIATGMREQMIKSLELQAKLTELRGKHRASIGNALAALVRTPADQRLGVWKTQIIPQLLSDGVPAALLREDEPLDDVSLDRAGRALLAYDKQVETGNKQAEEARNAEKFGNEKQKWPYELRTTVANADTAETEAARNLREEAERKFYGGLTNAERQAKAVEEMFKTATMNQSDRHHAESIATQRHGQDMTDARAREANATAGANRVVPIESQLRDDYTKATGTFVKVRDGYERLLSAGRLTGGPADIAFVFAFMKTIDPDSAVLPGEAANAQNAAGVPDWIRMKYNALLTGEKLLPETKQQFMQVAGEQYRGALENYRSVQDQYTDIARRSGANPQNVVIEHGEIVVHNGETFKFPSRAAADGFRQALKMRKK